MLSFKKPKFQCFQDLSKNQKKIVNPQQRKAKLYTFIHRHEILPQKTHTYYKSCLQVTVVTFGSTKSNFQHTIVPVYLGHTD